MGLDFTLGKYQELCEKIIISNYTPLIIEKYLTPNKAGKFIILGHKVDRKPERALKMAQIKEFRELVDIKTVCMHGNAFTKWINRDIWQKYNLRTFDLIGEPYLSIGHNEVLYLNDTSRTWDPKKYVPVDLAKIKNQFRERIKKYVCYNNVDGGTTFIKKRKNENLN